MKEERGGLQRGGPRIWKMLQSKAELLDGDSGSQHAPSSPNFWGFRLGGWFCGNSCNYYCGIQYIYFIMIFA